jgi:DnaJ family protein C protein 9
MSTCMGVRRSLTCGKDSAEELEDLKAAYIETGGSIEEIVNYIPHSTHDDEARFIIAISGIVASGDLPKLAEWEKGTKDEKARLVRKKQADKEAGEAEELARELGVWEEFYGSGKMGARKAKAKGAAKKATEDEDEDEEDVSALQALILKKQKDRGSFFDNLAAKYAEPEPKSKGKAKRKGRATEDEEPDESPRKKRRSAPDPPDLNDEEFEKLQKKLFGGKDKSSDEASGTKAKKAGKARRGK